MPPLASAGLFAEQGARYCTTVFQPGLLSAECIV